MRFSIIVPVYNVQDYLEKCLQSLLNQSFEDFEILIINDGSTDHSLAVCERFCDSRLKIFSQKNQGVSTARNLGLEKATGDFLVFVDPDDYVSPDHLMNLHEGLRSGDFSLLFNEIYFEKDGIKTVTDFGKNDKDKILSLDKAIEYCSHGMGFLGILVNKVFIRQIIQQYQIRFDPRIHQREDRLFCLEYLLAVKEQLPHSKALIISQPSYHYVNRASSQMNRINPKTYTALYAQEIIEQKTNSISGAIKKWNKNKRVTETIYLYHYAQQHPEILKALDAPLKQLLFEHFHALTHQRGATFFYLLTTSTIKLRQRIKLLQIFIRFPRNKN
jgi:glycosyltransferase involved in cell wall biosynthesis